MLENPLGKFSESLFVTLTGRTTGEKGLLVKKHVENLKTHGDFSFPSSLKPWIEHIIKHSATNEDAALLKAIGKTHEDIVDYSRNFNLQVRAVKEEKGRVYLFLDRPGTISLGLNASLRNTALVSEKLKTPCSLVRLDPLSEKPDCLTYLRVKYLGKVIENLSSILLKQDLRTPEIFVTSKSSSTCEGFKVLCSTVLSAKTSKKETDISATDFIR